MVKLHSAVGYSKTPVQITGKLHPQFATSDECAEGIRVILREVYGIKDEEVLDKVRLGHYFGGSISINLGALDRNTARNLRDVIIRHSDNQAQHDHNNSINVEFPSNDSTRATSAVVATIESMSETYGLKHRLEQAVRAVQEVQEQERSRL